MGQFQLFILKLLNSFPEVKVEFPSFFYDFLCDTTTLLNLFINFEDFSKLLGFSVTYSFISVCFAFADYLKNFRK